MRNPGNGLQPGGRYETFLRTLLFRNVLDLDARIILPHNAVPGYELRASKPILHDPKGDFISALFSHRQGTRTKDSLGRFGKICFCPFKRGNVS